MKAFKLGAVVGVMVAMDTGALIEVVADTPAQKRDHPIEIPRSMRCVFKHSWEDQHPNDDWRGKGNKKRRFK